MDKSELQRVQLAIKDLIDADDFENAMPVIYSVLEEHPNDAITLHFMGYIYLMGGKEPLAYQWFRRALEQMPQNHAIWTSLGRALHEMDRSEEALQCLLRAAAMNPEYAPAYSNGAAVLVQLSDWEGAEKACRIALEIDPTDLNSHLNLSHCYLATGRWKEGWAEWAKSLGGKYRKEWIYKDEPRWQGEEGKFLCIYGEQGLGDEMFYGSCIPDAIEKSAKVWIDCDPKLEGLFKRSFPRAEVHGTRRDEAPEWIEHAPINARCAVGGLPEFFRNSDADFPGTPYLQADPERRLMWRSLFNSWGGKTVIGITSQGGTKMTNQRGRKIAFEDWLPLLLKEGVEIVSLDYKPEDTEMLEELHGVKIHKFPWATQSNDYDDTAALIAELDMVIGVNTAAQHAAGGLGVPVITLVPKYHQWRYARKPMVWYKNTELVYQGDRSWNETIREAVEFV